MRNMNVKNRTVNKLAIVALVFALALPLVSKVYASGPFATNYTNASLTGVYGYSVYGWSLGAASLVRTRQTFRSMLSVLCGLMAMVHLSFTIPSTKAVSSLSVGP